MAIGPPSSILPSNAPPWSNGGDDHLSTRVLREQSGNRQSDFAGSNDLEPKYQYSSLNENGYPVRHHYSHVHHPRSQNPYHGRHYQSEPEKNAQRNAVTAIEAKGLYRYILSSEGYRKYRARQPKDEKSSGDQKWPEHLERAFFQSLVRWPPMGRRKYHWKGKQRGRNELIADHIEELTGESRTRKQVSSHIQVLKPFVEDDPRIMKYLSKHDLSGAHHDRHASYRSAYGRHMSHHPVPAMSMHGGQALLPLRELDPIISRRLRSSYEFFEPTSFDMFVQVPSAGEKRRFHTYSRSVREPRLADINISDWRSFGLAYPQLAAMHTQKPLECCVLVADSSLGMPTEDIPPGAEIGIQFLCQSQHISANVPIRCRTNFYQNGQFIDRFSGEKAVEVTTLENGCSIEAQVPLGSSYWAPTLHHLGKRLNEAASNLPTRQYEEDVPTFIKNITAVQEIVTVTDRERALVICWTFRKSSRPEGGTSWRKLNLPSPTQQPQEPKPDQYEQLFDLNVPLLDTSSQPPVLPTLQSPFEYDGTSAVSSATWPTTLSDPQNSFASAKLDPDNTFDFTGGHIDLSYESAVPMDTFDSTAFDFTSSNEQFAFDPALQHFGGQWDQSYSNLMDGESYQPPEDAQSYQTQAQDGLDHSHESAQQLTYQSQDSLGYQSQSGEGPRSIVENAHSQSFHMYPTQYDQQAYAGAGQELKEEDALSALADASFLARHDANLQ